MMLVLGVLILVCLAFGIQGAVHELSWDVTYINDANPDGLHQRRVISINNEWPPPQLRLRKGDRLVIHLNNMLDVPTAIHFHGVFQNGSAAMDGPSFVSQCPIFPGSTFTYDFKAEQVGTFWYHAHDRVQYGDGLRGALIVEDPAEDKPLKYDEDVIINLSDWYWQECATLLDNMFTPGSNGGEPSIDSSLFNDTAGGVRFKVEPDKVYYLRLINMGMSASQYFYIEDHELTIVEIDGVLVEPVVVKAVELATGQRYGVLLKTKATTFRNYAMVQATNKMMHKLYSQNWLLYNESQSCDPWERTTNQFSYIDDFTLKPQEQISRFTNPHRQIVMEYSNSYFTQDHIRYYTINGKPHLSPKIPTLLTVLSSNISTVSNPLIYGEATNAYILKHGEVVELVINSLDHMRHPFHLHGHNFQVVARGRREHFDPLVHGVENNLPEFPMIRDTVMVPSRGFVVLRFVADNPGVWFFHCHTDWHAAQGLGVIFIEAPELVLDEQTLPQNHIDVCKAAGIETQGNAAGNKDLLNMNGEIDVPKEYYKASQASSSSTMSTSHKQGTASQSMAESTQKTKEPVTTSSAPSHTHERVSFKTQSIVLSIYLTIAIVCIIIGVYFIRRASNPRLIRELPRKRDYDRRQLGISW